MRVIGYYHYVLDDDNEPPVSQMQKVTSGKRGQSQHNVLSDSPLARSFLPTTCTLAPDQERNRQTLPFLHPLLLSILMHPHSRDFKFTRSCSNFSQKGFPFQNPFSLSLHLNTHHVPFFHPDSALPLDAFRVLVTWSGEQFKTTTSIISPMLT